MATSHDRFMIFKKNSQDNMMFHYLCPILEDGKRWYIMQMLPWQAKINVTLLWKESYKRIENGQINSTCNKVWREVGYIKEVPEKVYIELSL